ncbi:MAG: diguanylate cyclase [Dehalococcoidia bacterium]|nr:diguanylate cyclase [Dehalococcoidia bacterium]
MNVYSLIPLIACIAFVPLFIILTANQPWQRQHKLFALFVFTAILCSFGDLLFRSDLFIDAKIYIGKVVLCILALAFTQLHYFLRSFYESAKPKYYLAYIGTALVCIVAILFLPADVKLGEAVVPVYGMWVFPYAGYAYGLLLFDIYRLTNKFRAAIDPILRKQIICLITATTVYLVFPLFTISKLGQDYPISHIGNIFNGLILTFAVVKYHLLNMRFGLHRGLTFIIMAGIGMGIYLGAYLIANTFFGIQVIPLNYFLGGLICIAIILAGLLLRDATVTQVNKLFYRDSYEYHQKLDNFLRQKIKEMPGLDDLGNEFLTLICGTFRCEHAFLLLPHTADEDFLIRFAVPARDNLPLFLIKQDSPIIQWIKKHHSTLRNEAADISPELRTLWKQEKNKMEQFNIQMFIPILSREKIIGLLALGDKQNKSPYTLEEITRAEKTCAQIAASLEKEHLQDQLKKREQELSLINRLAGVISSSLNIKEVYDVFVSELKEVVEADFTAITTVESNEICFSALTTDVGSAWRTGQKIPLAGTATEWVFTNKKPFYERDLTRNKRFWTATEYAKRGIHSLLFLPLMVKGEVIGVLILGSLKPYAYSHEQVTLLEHLASQIAAPIENSRLYTRAEETARIDVLTELFNRKHFDERLTEEINRHSRYGDMLTLLLLDLDNFKKYNDTFGHVSGDKQLALAGKLIRGSIRSSDLAFRYGGDEFAIILPNSTTVESFSVAERVRERISFEMSSKQLDITVSIGMASWPGDGRTLDELCSSADTALYYAKRTGQNRTSIASKTMFSLTEPPVNASAETEVLSTIYALAATLEARDKYTYGHSRKVSRYAVSIAESLGLPPEQVTIISAAALLHDIGKIGIPDNVLNKNEKLLEDEWELLKSHPKLSATIIGHIPSLTTCLAAVKHHHERWDGNGYPAGLLGEGIPIEARILAVADAFEAMISDRPYRGPFSYKKALNELERCSGSQFDPCVVKAFIPIALSTAPDDMELEIYQSSQETE